MASRVSRACFKLFTTPIQPNPPMASKSVVLAAAVFSALSPGVFAGLFTVNCAPLTVQRGDPIVFPGVLASHAHAVAGGTAFALIESNDRAKAASATTCDKTLDHSNYWQPQLYHQRTDGKFEMVEMQGIVSSCIPVCLLMSLTSGAVQAAYYIDRACDYVQGRKNCANTPHAKAPPAGLRMVVGDPSLRFVPLLRDSNPRLIVSQILQPLQPGATGSLSRLSGTRRRDSHSTHEKV